ncbi:MAG: YeiH family putative sulfate export transporter [Bradyrhizobiaceae bacterium]|jgi:uncharacterized integral membrane protein (TIGR00698 family)|nr:YeiH family putative sulfate export transporter [Afipia sp.]RTL76008.1 MAG: YeiH family putative sulfate export transporter [Bradyrhizobiaceae bacterium]
MRAQPIKTSQSFLGKYFQVLIGAFLCFTIALIAFVFRKAVPQLTIVSPMAFAITIGVIANNTVGTPTIAKPGVKFCMRHVLRLGIAMLGLQLTFPQIFDLGLSAFGIITVSLIGSVAFTLWLGRKIGVDRGLTELIAAGTAICGASAVLATNNITRAPEEDAIYAVACVTILGSFSIALYPVVSSLIGLGPKDFGLWCGSSIHEIAQVVAAAFQNGETAGEAATISKLSRVVLLAPLVMFFGLVKMSTRRSSINGPSSAPGVPWFVVGFIAMVGLNSVVHIPEESRTVIVLLTAVMLTASLAAMGLETDFSKLKARGAKPFLLAIASWVFIASFSLMLIKFVRS